MDVRTAQWQKLDNKTSTRTLKPQRQKENVSTCKLTGVLKSTSFKGGDIDPCLLFKKTEKGLVLIGLYVDDLLIIRDDADIDEVIADIEKHFKVKVKENLKDYLSCKICFDEEMKMAWIGQPHLIQKL